MSIWRDIPNHLVQGLDKAGLLWGLQSLVELTRGALVSEAGGGGGVISGCPEEQVTKPPWVEGAASAEVQGQNRAGH